MALFDKLFSIKRKLDSDIREPRNRDRSCQINPEQVRLLLFKECDWRGRKLLFDSSVIQKVPAGKNDKPDKQTNKLPCIVEVSDGFSYMYKGPAADASVLGEMIFGAVAMNYKNVSLKIHIMDEPRRLMCTKIFCVPSRRTNRVEHKTSERGEGTSLGDLRNGSKPLSVTSLRDEGVSLSFSLDRGDSGFYSDLSSFSSVGSTYDYFSMFETWDGSKSQDDVYSFHCSSSRKLSTSSNGSWQRRTFQNIATRFDVSRSSSNLFSVPTASTNGTRSDSQIYSNSSTSGTRDSIASGGSSILHKKTKLGLALVITVADSAEMDVVRRCVEHSPQLQALVRRLRLGARAAGVRAGAAFVSTLHRAATDAATWLSDLVYGPRLQPVWLNLVTGDACASNKIAESLLSDICFVLSAGDAKHTNFFISTLLTHVLTYHLGWVTTVSPYDTVDYHKTSPDSIPDSPRPYNALWAQLGDLCGSIGFPPRASRTIISGANKTTFINRLLVVLTYFMRCGDVTRTDYQFQNSALNESKVISVNKSVCSLKRTATRVNGLAGYEARDSLKVPVITQNSDSSVSTLVASDVGMKRSSTLANLSQQLSNSAAFAAVDGSSTSDNPMTNQLRRNPTMMLSSKASSDSSLNSSVSDFEPEQKVVFVLGDNDKLVGLKNKSGGGKSVKKSSKVHNEPVNLDVPDNKTERCTKTSCDQVKNAGADSPTKCCGQTLQHSKPIKHSGFKFEFDKYPQIVTNYMKSKNLEILDRHYIGKPGNLKLDNFQFDPTVVPPIQEERCEACVKCQMLESMLQTPTNASEMEYMNDIPRQSEPQFAKETIVDNVHSQREMSPKTFVRRREENTVVVNITKSGTERPEASVEGRRPERNADGQKEKLMDVKEAIYFPAPRLCESCAPPAARAGFHGSLLGGLTDHYVPDLILQGTIASPKVWEGDLRRDLHLTSYLNDTFESPLQSVAIIGDTNTWEVCVRMVGGGGAGGAGGAGGMSSLVGGMLDALPLMWRAKVPAHQCLSFLEGKLREFCVLSKTLADMLMSTDFCDIATLTKSLNIDVNDVPLLLAVATTHTPQIATRYGISYR